jgi:hypothetical protein
MRVRADRSDKNLPPLRAGLPRAGDAVAIVQKAGAASDKVPLQQPCTASSTSLYQPLSCRARLRPALGCVIICGASVEHAVSFFIGGLGVVTRLRDARLRGLRRLCSLGRWPAPAPIAVRLLGILAGGAQQRAILVAPSRDLGRSVARSWSLSVVEAPTIKSGDQRKQLLSHRRHVLL